MSSTLGSPSLLAGSERGREAVDPVQGLQGLRRAGHTDKAKDRYSTNSRYFFAKQLQISTKNYTKTFTYF